MAKFKPILKVKIVGGDASIRSMFGGNPDRRYMAMNDDIFTTPDLVLFTGGADVDPKLYNEHIISGTNISEKRDKQDIAAYERFKDVPKVGICRGGQFLNVMNGGALWQDVNNHAIGNRHTLVNLLPIEGKRDMGDEIQVTSTHHQMMITGDRGEVIGIAQNSSGTGGLATNYRSGTKREKPKYDTEVVWYENTKSLCYQPHPEYQRKTDGEMYFFDLLDYFFRD